MGPAQPVDYELPREAVGEAIVNAVAHPDYASNASVQVMLFADRLEVWNPGELPPSLTLDELRRPHASIPRNPLIAEPIFSRPLRGEGGDRHPDMISRCREAGLLLPEFRQSGGQFVQALGRPQGCGDPGSHAGSHPGSPAGPDPGRRDDTPVAPWGAWAEADPRQTHSRHAAQRWGRGVHVMRGPGVSPECGEEPGNGSP